VEPVVGRQFLFGQAAFDAGVVPVLLASVALAAVLARHGGRTRMLVVAAATALPLSLAAIVWAGIAGVGF
jgi:hypothetical protein